MTSRPTTTNDDGYPRWMRFEPDDCATCYGTGRVYDAVYGDSGPCNECIDAQAGIDALPDAGALFDDAHDWARIDAAAYAVERAALELFAEMERDGISDPGSERVQAACLIHDIMVRLGVCPAAIPAWLAAYID